MTVNEARTKLLEYFINNTSFSFKTDFKRLFPIYDESIEAAAQLALEALEAEKIILLDKTTKVWVLINSLKRTFQTVYINNEFAVYLGQTYSELCEKFNLKIPPVDPMNISEDDIKNLLLILSELASKNINQSNETEEE